MAVDVWQAEGIQCAFVLPFAEATFDQAKISWVSKVVCRVGYEMVVFYMVQEVSAFEGVESASENVYVVVQEVTDIL